MPNLAVWFYYYPLNEWVQATDEDHLPSLIADGIIVIATRKIPNEVHYTMMFNALFHACCDEVVV